jgi:hypothetical protein
MARVAGAPAALVGIIVCLVRIGVLGTLVVVSLTAAALFALLRLYPALYRHKPSAPGVALRAEASWEGWPGVLCISGDRLEFSSKTGQVTSLAKSEVSTADLADVRRLVRGTRATLETGGGEVFIAPSPHPPQTSPRLSRTGLGTPAPSTRDLGSAAECCTDPDTGFVDLRARMYYPATGNS